MRKRGDSPRDHAQRLGQLTRGRFGSASLPHIPPHLTCDRHAKNGANALTVAHLAWRSARSLKPRRKISEFYFVFHADILHGNLHYIQPFCDFCNPFIAADRRQPLGDSFIQRRVGHFHYMRHPVPCPELSCGTSEPTSAWTIRYSLCIRYSMVPVLHFQILPVPII